MAEIQKRTVIDRDSGAVISQKVSNFNLFDERKGYLFWKNRQCVKTYPGIEYPDGVTERDELILARLTRYIYSNTNMLAYRGNGNVIKPMDTEYIAKATAQTHRNAANFMKRMLALGVIAKVTVHCEDEKEIQYYINPIYYFSGNRLPLNLYLLFRTQLDRYLPDWVKEKFAEQEKAFKNTKGKRRK